MHRILFTLLAGALTLGLLGTESAEAQSYSQSSRAFVQSPQALGMGDAGVAFSSRQNVFFYNPAHLAEVATLRPRFNIVGVRGSLSDNLFDQVDYFQNTLEPALDEGLENKSNDELEELYDETIAIGRQRTLLNGDVLLPSVMLKVGDVGVGGGVFGHSVLRYRFDNAGAGVPLVDMSAMADLMFVGSAGLDLTNYGVSGLSAGLTGKMTQRWLTVKNKALDAIEENEDVYLLKGSSIGFDLGFLYDLAVVPLPGDLTLGFAAYDIVGGSFDYAFSSNLTENSADNARIIAEEEELANEVYSVEPSFRLGASYMVPGVSGLPLLKNTGVAVDYLWFSNPMIDQEFLAGLHMGAQAQLSVVVLRLGLNQGYTTLGAGLDVGFATLDYAYFGVEQGRYPGQLPGWNHTVQATFGF